MNPQPCSESGAALNRCTGLDRSTFLAYWSKEPLLSHCASGFADLLSAADIDELIAERALRPPFFRMVKDGDAVAGTTRAVAGGHRRAVDIADPDTVREEFAAGATLVLQSLHRFHPPLVRFCRTLGADLGHAVQCNAYVTPPDAQGFAPHHDTHDVFVLQIDGRKRWNVYPPALALPLPSQPSKELAGDEPLVAEGTAPLLSVELGPGDALYLPRGFIHAAQTTADRSIHLTVGVLAATAYDVLRDVVTLAADELAFREALPLGPAEDQLAAVAGIVARAAQWLAELPPEQARGAVRERLSRAHTPAPMGMLASEEHARHLDKDSVVRPRRGLVTELVAGADAERVALVLPDRELSLPSFVAAAVRALLTGPCNISELDLPVDDAIVLTRRLIREGVLEGASDA